MFAILEFKEFKFKRYIMKSKNNTTIGTPKKNDNEPKENKVKTFNGKRFTTH